MSLIIARKEGQKIFLIGDTRLTDSPVLPDPSRPDNVQKVADPRDGAIKITLFNSQLCIAFAGASATANEVIKKCRSLSVDQIMLLLRQENNLSENKIQFIVAIGHPEYELIEIKEGKVNRTINMSWIGSPKGFKQYEDTLFKLEKSNTDNIHDSLYLSQKAFTEVLQSNLEPEVNGFPITVTNQSGAFTYSEFMTVEIVPFTFSGIGILTHGSAQAGGYSVNICPSEQYPDILPVHILQGRIGIIYQSKDGGLLMPEVLADTDDFEFAEILSERFGIQKKFGITTAVKSYFDRGIKAANKRDFSRAVSLYTKGLSQPSDELKPLLNLNLAYSLFHLSKFREALSYAQTALRLNPTLWPQVKQLIDNISKATQSKR